MVSSPLSAIASISIAASFGNLATWKVARAGESLGKTKKKYTLKKVNFPLKNIDTPQKKKIISFNVPTITIVNT